MAELRGGSGWNRPQRIPARPCFADHWIGSVLSTFSFFGACVITAPERMSGGVVDAPGSESGVLSGAGGAVTATTRRPRHGVVPVRSPRSLAARGALLAAAGLVAGTVVLAPHAGAANRSGRRTPAAGRDAATAARTLAADLGSRTAGSYLDASGRLVVTVTDDGALAAGRA